MTTMNAQTLVAMNWSGAGDIRIVLHRLADTVIEHVETTTPHYKTGEPIETHRVTFDANRIRNTNVHGIAYRAGFVSHIE